MYSFSSNLNFTVLNSLYLVISAWSFCEKRMWRKSSASERLICGTVQLIKYIYLYRLYNYIVAYLLEARTMEPEEQPLLANGKETASFLGNGCEAYNGTTSVPRQQILNKQEQTAAAKEGIGKHVPATTHMHATEKRCFLCGPCRDVISKGEC
jgi:hypothetical protein